MAPGASVAVVGSTRDPNARQGGASSLRILGVPSTSAQTRRAEEGSFAMLERRTALDSLSPCTYLSAILLGGLALNALLGWWWADPVAALVMVPIIAKEGVEALQGKSCCEDDACDANA